MDSLFPQSPFPYPIATAAELRCVASTAWLLARDRLHLPLEHLGLQLRFADGTSTRVFRETVADVDRVKAPCILFVEFRLRLVRGRWHAAFHWESLLNTPLFAGFPGFVSKLWLANDERGFYRGLYEWDGPARAESYARSLWRVLQLGCEPDSIHYWILPGLRRDELLAAPQTIDALAPAALPAWARLIATG
jgi:hypothetical protein